MVAICLSDARSEHAANRRCDTAPCVGRRETATRCAFGMVNGYVHHQMSRYPTPIDGVDSSKVYARHRDGVGRLLAKIRGAYGALLPHLDSRLPPPPPFPRDVHEALARE